MPAMPRAGFVMVKAEFVLGGLEAVFDCPATAFDGNERWDACSGWAPGREECEITVADVATNEKAAGPKPSSHLVIFVCVEIGQFAVGPVMKSCAFGTVTGGQTLPRTWVKIASDLLSRACDRRLT